jgi:hypothetical protein
VIFCVLGNDARNIALKRKSDPEKAADADELANKFCDLLEARILNRFPHIYILISMLLPRNDCPENTGLSSPNTVRRIVNVQITTRFYLHPRVGLIFPDCLEWGGDETRYRQLYQADGYHLTQLGFNLMIQNWIDNLVPHVRAAGSEPQLMKAPPPPNPLLVDEDAEKVVKEAVVLATAPEVIENGGGGGETAEKEVLPPKSAAEVDNTVPDPFGSYTGKRTRRRFICFFFFYKVFFPP